jgi:adenylate cyclase
MASVRRLTAILAADVAGYSRLMGVDEEGTHERLQAHLRELVDPKIKEHRGRIVKNTGDGFLAEFASVVDVVRCAAEMQRGMAEANAAISPEKRTEFRMGINLGDVIAQDDDIFGDGVNIAARLQALAEPRGICVSGVVRDQVRDKLDFGFEDLGEQSVKNIARPVRVYALRAQSMAERPIAGVPIALPPLRRRVVAPITAGIAAVLVIAVIAWWVWPPTKSSSTTPAAVAATTSVAQPLVAPRLSIVVLPFANLSNDPDQQYFADGITEDLTTDLSRIVDMFVISRNTAFTYHNKPVDTKQIGRELGVRYVLEGSVQRSGKQVRVSAQLIDAESDAHLWAARFDREMVDLFALQNEITGQIAYALGNELIAAENANPTNNPDAMDFMLRGRAQFAKPPSRDSFAEMISQFERAVALDPRSVVAKSYLTTALMGRVMNGMSDSAPADIKRAEGLVSEALAASPRNPLAHLAKGFVLNAQNRVDEAIPEYETALASNRNWALVIATLGWLKFMTGSLDDAIPPQEQAIRLSPRDSLIGVWYQRIGMVHLLQSRTDAAIPWLEKARNANPVQPAPHAWLASAYALKADTQRAATELAEARRLITDDRWSSIARLKAVGHFGVPQIRALFEATYFSGLRKAGMPEE